MKKLLLLALVASLAITALAFVAKPPGRLGANVADASGEDELQYPIDVEALRAEFRDTGGIVLRVPVLGEIRIVGEETNLTSDGDRQSDWPGLPFRGGVEGYARSTANIVIGEYGLYGSVEIPVPDTNEQVRYEFDAVETDSGFELWVHLSKYSASPQALQTSE